MVVFKRKQAVITIIICMVMVAGYINWAYQTGGGEKKEVANIGEMQLASESEAATAVSANAEGADVIKKAKEDRNTARSRAMETLKTTMSDSALSAEAKKAAETEYLAMATAIEKEGICEGALATKGITDSVVFISNGSINVSVKTENELTEADITKIKDVIITGTGAGADKIKISRIK